MKQPPAKPNMAPAGDVTTPAQQPAAALAVPEATAVAPVPVLVAPGTSSGSAFATPATSGGAALAVLAVACVCYALASKPQRPSWTAIDRQESNLSETKHRTVF